MPASPFQLLVILFLAPVLTGVWAVAASPGSLAQRLAMLPTLAALAILWLADPATAGLTTLLPLSAKLPALTLAFQNGPVLYYRIGMVLAVYAGVQLYSTGYIIRRGRLYFALLGLFCLGMMALVLSGNYLTLLLGWEVIGLCSYALISTYFSQPPTGGSALRVFLINRFGDMMLLGAVAGIYAHQGHLGFYGVEALPQWIGYLIAGAALVKSAQVPFSAWLRMAMVGPSPVSALLHSATLVVAGVVLILKTGTALGSGPLLLVAAIGVVSALYGAIRAIYSHDCKAILAWSTVSHMGLLMAGAGAQALPGTSAHILAHAFFKAPLFLLVGLLPGYKMKAVASPQSLIRDIGGFLLRTKILLIVLMICTLSAIGAPFLAGSFSKDALFAGLLATAFPSWSVWAFIAAYTLLTLAYMARFMLGLAAGLSGPDGLAPWVRPHHIAAIAALSLGVFPYAVLRNLDWLGHPASTPVLEYAYPMLCLLAFAPALWLVRTGQPSEARNPFSFLLLPEATSISTGIKAASAPFLHADDALSRLPLLLARGAVVAAHLQTFLEAVLVSLAAVTFRLAQWPVRTLAVQVTGYRISAILAVALLTLVGLVAVLGW